VTTVRPEDQLPLMLDNFRAMGSRMRRAERPRGGDGAKSAAGAQP